MKKIARLILSLMIFLTFSCEMLESDNNYTNCVTNEETFDKTLLLGSWYYEGNYSSESEITDNIGAIEAMSMVTEWIALNYIIFTEDEISQYYWFDGSGFYSDTSLSYQYELVSDEIMFSINSTNLGKLKIKHFENNSEHIILIDEENQEYYLFTQSGNLSYIVEHATNSSDYSYLDFLMF